MLAIYKTILFCETHYCSYDDNNNLKTGCQDKPMNYFYKVLEDRNPELEYKRTSFDTSCIKTCSINT